ncbi:MAG TPA: hypothetical protein VIL34_19785 [Actinopolymorphaceae bacterium]
MTTPLRRVTIRAWKSTAEVYADPEIAEVLRRGVTGDYGPVPKPSPVPQRAKRRKRSAA